MDRLKIPTSVALLGLCFTGCGKGDEDSIVGTWDATMLDDTAFPYTEVGQYGEMLTQKLEMRIADDLTGTYKLEATYSYPGEQPETEAYTFGLMVDDDAGPEYVITVPDAAVILTCTVDGASMACTGEEGNTYKFKRR